MSEELMQIYVEETKEHLEILDTALLALEKNPYDRHSIDAVFRAAHTIKGSSSAMGFLKMERLTHDMEDILHDIRDKKIEADKKVIELLFICHDFIENSLDSIIRTGNEEEINSDSILGKLHKIIEERHKKTSNPHNNDKKVDDELDITNEKYSLLNEYISKGYKFYKLDIRLSNECVFRTVRILLTFREIENVGIIISSSPENPDEEEAKKEDFTLDNQIIKALIVSKYSKEEVIKELDVLQEVEKICVETYTTSNQNLEVNAIKLISLKDKTCALNKCETNEDSLVNDIIGDNEDNFIEIEKEFDDDIKDSIAEQIEKININIILIHQEQEVLDILYILFRSFHTIKGLANFTLYNEILNISSRAENLLDKYMKEEIQIDTEFVDLILASSDMILKICNNPQIMSDDEFVKKYENQIKHFEKKDRGEVEEKKLGEILIERGKIKEEDLKELLIKQKENYKGLKLGQVAVKEKIVEPSDIIESLRSQDALSKKNGNSTSADNGFMRIPVKKVDNLVDLLGEMLVFYSILEREAKEEVGLHSNFMNHLSRMAKTIKDIQGLSMSLRMVSLRPTFQKLIRIGRDAAVELGKEVDIVVSGEDTEVDRSIVEKLFDPLMHIVRNSVSHGLESDQERKLKGKEEKGRVNINAYSKRGCVYIEIKDNGKGIDTELILKRAKEKNLINPDIEYSTDEINRLIFLPGFSTMDKANNISGRGVGMNVVETEMSKIGGKVDLVNTPGKGCEFILKIPINLAVINGTIVDLAGIRYIIPTLYIKHLLKPEEEQWISVKGKREFIKIREEIIGLIPSHQIFDTKNNGKTNNMVVVLEVEQNLKAFPVDEVLGRQEVVAKPLNEEFNGLKFASGASILGDGRVSLILDVEELFKLT